MPRVGVIKPSTRPGRAEELVMMLPKEIELEHAGCRIASGTRKELEQSFADFETKVAEMATLGVDLIHPAGVPFLLLGFEGERALVRRWENEHKIPIFTNGMSQVNAVNAYGARRIIAASYFPAETTRRSQNISSRRAWRCSRLSASMLLSRMRRRSQRACCGHFLMLSTGAIATRTRST